jgi:hypothetical protein
MITLQLSPTRLGRAAEVILGLTELQRLFARRQPGCFAAQSLHVLNIEVAIAGDATAIPAAGPAVIVANHPGGAVDGLALLQTAQQRRADVKLLANHLLCRIPDLREHAIGVNPFRARCPKNVRGLREARRWLAAGGALIVFPAGEVSSVTDSDAPACRPLPLHRSLRVGTRRAGAATPATSAGTGRDPSGALPGRDIARPCAPRPSARGRSRAPCPASAISQAQRAAARVQRRSCIR